MNATLLKALLGTYSLAWKAAIPLLKFNNRMQDGWDQRTLSEGLPAPAHLWIQAASGGEAYLAWEVLKTLKPTSDESLRVLVTTNTLQGYEILTRAAEEVNAQRVGVAVQPWYFPFDLPDYMDRMVEHVHPELALILETEIWPGFLNACKKKSVRILLANGRMTSKSLGGYMTCPGLFRSFGPDHVMAVSEEDARRFGTLFGRDKIWIMPNIKFDRMDAAGPMDRNSNPLKDIVPDDAPFVILGSVRKEEMTDVRKLTAALVRIRPQTILGIFPRHMHHLPKWEKALNIGGLTWTKRSDMQGPARPGTVILFDTFGELVPAYGLATTAFIGGSLAPLGGQNFLEPLTCGVSPVIGPHWKNFAWVGRDIFDAGLIHQGEDAEHVLNLMINVIDNPPPRSDVSKQAKEYIRDRQGGTEAVCKQVAQFLKSV